MRETKIKREIQRTYIVVIKDTLGHIFDEVSVTAIDEEEALDIGKPMLDIDKIPDGANYFYAIQKRL